MCVSHAGLIFVIANDVAKGENVNAHVSNNVDREGITFCVTNLHLLLFLYFFLLAELFLFFSSSTFSFKPPPFTNMTCSSLCNFVYFKLQTVFITPLGGIITITSLKFHVVFLIETRLWRYISSSDTHTI